MKAILRPAKLSHGAGIILRLGFAAVAAELVYVASSLSALNAYDTARLGLYIYSMLEHILMSAALTVGGALLYDIAYREKTQD